MRAAFARGLSVGVFAMLALLALAAVVLPAATGSHTFTITGRSMEPVLRLGTLIVATPTDPAEINVGDIITFQLRSGEAAVATHRVVGLEYAGEDRRFVTSGDNNQGVIDAEPVRPEQLVGRYWYGIPFVGWVNAVLTGEVRAWVIPLATGALFAYGLWMVASELVARRRKAEEPDQAILPKQDQSAAE